MKKILLILAVLSLTITGFSQGIKFETGTWKEVLEKAKQANKPIFVDVFASWCGPCKMMSSQIFPLPEVGKFYNDNFICYKIDAEKGEGIELAKKYEVRAYPTYIFVKSDGTLFFRALGSMEASQFIEVAKSALAELNDPKPLAVWEKEYAAKKNDPAFLLAYINKRSGMGVSSVNLVDDYLKLIPETERTSDAVAELYKKEGTEMKVTSLAYKNLMANRAVFSKKLSGTMDEILIEGIMNTMRDAARAKDEIMLSPALSAYDQLSQNPPQALQKEEIYMQYYFRTKDTEKYLKYASEFCNKLMKKGLSSPDKNEVSANLNSVAWKFFDLTSDVMKLQEALSWSKRSLEIAPGTAMFMDTYANLLYKLGRKDDAIATEEVAIRKAEKEDVAEYQKTLAKMKAGEKTWK